MLTAIVLSFIHSSLAFHILLFSSETALQIWTVLCNVSCKNYIWQRCLALDLVFLEFWTLLFLQISRAATCQLRGATEWSDFNQLTAIKWTIHNASVHWIFFERGICTYSSFILFVCLLYPRSPKGEGGILFYLCPSKIFFVTFFSVTVDGRNLIFGHKRHIGIPYCGWHFWTRQIPTCCLPT